MLKKHSVTKNTVWMNCSSDLKNFANSQPSASNFKSFSQPLDQFFLTVGQNNFGNKIQLRHRYLLYRRSFIVFTYYLFKDWSAFVINVSYDDIMYIEISFQDIYVTRMEVKKKIECNFIEVGMFGFRAPQFFNRWQKLQNNFLRPSLHGSYRRPFGAKIIMKLLLNFSIYYYDFMSHTS